MNLPLFENLVPCLGWTLVHFLWQGLAAAVGFALCQRLLRAAPANQRYLAGCAALLTMIGAPLLTLAHEARQYQSPTPATFHSVPALAPGIAPSVEMTDARISTATKVLRFTRPVPRSPGITARIEAFMPWVVIAWALGVCALSSRLTVSWLHVRWLTREGIIALNGTWPGRLAELTQRLGISRPVRLLQSGLVEVPTVIGWLRPVILLPASCLAGLTPAQLEAVLAHELAHIRRHDYLVNLFQSAVETLLFYHPAVWWVSRRIREERELCCDDLTVRVCRDRVAYARALATLEELRLAPPQVAVAAGGMPLLERIRRLAQPPEKEVPRSGWIVALVLAFTIVAAIFVSLRSHGASAESSPDGTTTAKSPASNALTNFAAMTPVTTNSMATNASIPSAQTPPQVDIKCQFVELDQWDFPSHAFSPLAIGITNAEPLSISGISIGFPEVFRYQLTNNVAEIFSAVLDRRHFPTILHALDQRAGVDVLTSPQITTESGRRAEIQIGETTSILTNRSGPAITNLSFGPALDVRPEVGTNGFTVKLDAKATLSRLTDKPSVAMPRMQFTQLTRTADVRDGDTLVMGGAEGPASTTGARRKWLLVFVTPTLINPNGTRYHSDTDMPHATTPPPPVVTPRTTNSAAMQYNNSSEIYPVVSSMQAAEPGQLFTRVFHVDRNIFTQALARALGTNGSESAAGADGAGAVGSGPLVPGVHDTQGLGGPGFSLTATPSDRNQAAFMAFFAQAGVNLTAPGRAVFWSDRSGAIMVHASLPELGIVSHALDALDKKPPLINLKVKFVELVHGVDLGKFHLGDLAHTGSARNSTGPSEFMHWHLLTNTSPDGVIVSSNLPNTMRIDGVATYADSQYKDAIRSLENQPDAKVKTLPEGTTENGIQVHFEVPTSGSAGQDSNTAIHLALLGPALDLTPEVSADTNSIGLSVVMAVPEFLGYTDNSSIELSAAFDQRGPIGSPKPLAKFSLHSFNTSGFVPDGQTVAILIKGDVILTKDKVPVPGDLPLLGRFFRSESMTKMNKTNEDLLIFITPTLVNPDGTTFHSGEELGR